MERSIEDVRRLVSQEEGQTLEFRRSALMNLRILSRILAALANSSGGTVVLAVDETRADRIVGVSDPIREEQALQKAIERLDPIPEYTVQRVSVDGQVLIVVDIPASGLTLSPDGAFIRVGDRSIRCPRMSCAVSLKRRLSAGRSQR